MKQKIKSILGPRRRRIAEIKAHILARCDTTTDLIDEALKEMHLSQEIQLLASDFQSELTEQDFKNSLMFGPERMFFAKLV